MKVAFGLLFCFLKKKSFYELLQKKGFGSNESLESSFAVRSRLPASKLSGFRDTPVTKSS